MLPPSDPWWSLPWENPSFRDSVGYVCLGAQVWLNARSEGDRAFRCDKFGFETVSWAGARGRVTQQNSCFRRSGAHRPEWRSCAGTQGWPTSGQTQRHSTQVLCSGVVGLVASIRSLWVTTPGKLLFRGAQWGRYVMELRYGPSVDETPRGRQA